MNRSMQMRKRLARFQFGSRRRRFQFIERAERLGARGIVLKEATTDLLFKAIRSVVAGEYWVDRGRVTDLAQTLYTVMHQPEAPMKARFGMTPREQQIVAA